MGYSLPSGLQEAVTRFDPAVEILWNNRTGRWVVACLGIDMVKVDPALLGVARITGEKSHYSPIFTCEAEDVNDPRVTVPIVPGDWILAKLYELRPYKHRTSSEYDKLVDTEEAAKAAAFERHLDDKSANFKTEMNRYGGDVNGFGLHSRKHVLVSGNPLSKD